MTSGVAVVLGFPLFCSNKHGAGSGVVVTSCQPVGWTGAQ